MDKQKYIEEMAKELSKVQQFGTVIEESCMDCRNDKRIEIKNSIVAEALYNAGYRNISKAAADCLAGEDTGLKIIDHYIKENHELSAKNKKVRKETAENFAERLKGIDIRFELQGSKYSQADIEKTAKGLLEAIMQKVDEICMEITEGKNDRNE